MSIPETEQVEHGGADCRQCPAYEYCEVDTVQGSHDCREMLSPYLERRQR